MLATALGAGSNATVVTNSSGSNMPAGHLAALTGVGKRSGGP